MRILRVLSGRLFEGGEETLLKECSKMVAVAFEANAALKSLTTGTADIANMRGLERKADQEKFRIANLITSGAVAPNVLDNMLVLLGQQDNIVNSIYNVSRELHRYKVRDGEKDRHLRESVIDISNLVDAALDTLLKMYAQGNVGTLRTLREAIENLEEAGDGIKDDLLDLAYTESVDFRSFYHIIQVARLADNILDGCEDSADALLTIISSIIT